MARLGIFTGTTPNDGTGDTLSQGAVKVNSNFSEIYTAIGDGTNITNTISFANTSTNVVGGIASVTSLNVSGGISTVGFLTATNINVVGIVTASSFTGNLTGTATTANNVSSTININTTGIVTASSFTGNLTGTATTASNLPSNININTSGIITASSFVGNLTGAPKEARL